jgi:hypothetical protein
LSTNQHGLSRSIPDAVKREVRQRCGFGCVNCTASIYEYDHFDPEFADAKEHHANGITLLCPTCHALKTKGILSKQTLIDLNASPASKTLGHSKIQLPYFKGIPTVQFGGGVLIQNSLIPFQIYDQPIIILRPPEKGSTVTRISALIRGATGEEVLRITDNEWRTEKGAWDFEWVGQRMTVRDSSKAKALQITIAPPDYISIDSLVTDFAGHRIRVSPTELRVNTNVFRNCTFDSWEVGIQLGSRSPWLEAAQGGAGVYLKD